MDGPASPSTLDWKSPGKLSAITARTAKEAPHTLPTSMVSPNCSRIFSQTPASGTVPSRVLHSPTRQKRGRVSFF
jgi:hypothetical protein